MGLFDYARSSSNVVTHLLNDSIVGDDEYDHDSIDNMINT